jgi:phthalate 4,5-dioxygenase
MKAQLNELLTQVGPGSACGHLMRHYWQPVALVDEFNPRLDARMGTRALKSVRVLGQDLVLFKENTAKSEPSRWGLLDRSCPHRGADLAFARHEGDGIRCPFHGWKFAADGQCLDTPAEPAGSTLCQHVRQRSYPVQERAGVLFAWLGPQDAAPPPLPALDCFAAPASHSFAFKGLWHCNWLQAFEVGIDPAHPSFLHRFFQDDSLQTTGDNAAGKQFRSASAGQINGEHWPMSRIMREFHKPDIRFEPHTLGWQLTTLRPMNAQLTHVRVTQAVQPHTFIIPLSETVTITQMHLPVDDTHTYWYAIFTSYAQPLDQDAMRAQRLRYISLPDYIPKAGRWNNWNFNPEEQQARTYLGMGEDDINVHDQWAVESMGAIADRTLEHLGTSDKVIMANRRWLQKNIEALQAGQALEAQAAGTPVLHTLDGIAPADNWQAWWQEKAAYKRQRAGWLPLPEGNSSSSSSEPSHAPHAPAVAPETASVVI